MCVCVCVRACVCVLEREREREREREGGREREHCGSSCLIVNFRAVVDQHPVLVEKFIIMDCLLSIMNKEPQNKSAV